MRKSPSGAHFRGHPDRFHDLLVGGALLERLARVPLDAIRALRDVRHRHRDQLLGRAGQLAIGKHLGAEGLERFQRPRRQLVTPARQLDGGRRIHGIAHDDLPRMSGPPVYAPRDAPRRLTHRYRPATTSTNASPPIHVALPAKPGPTSASGAARPENTTIAAMTTPRMLSPTIRPDDSSTPSCLRLSGSGSGLSARWLKNHPTSAPTAIISVMSEGRYTPSPTASGGKRTLVPSLPRISSRMMNATPMPAPIQIRFHCM